MEIALLVEHFFSLGCHDRTRPQTYEWVTYVNQRQEVKFRCFVIASTMRCCVNPKVTQNAPAVWI